MFGSTFCPIISYKLVNPHIKFSNSSQECESWKENASAKAQAWQCKIINFGFREGKITWTNTESREKRVPPLPK